MSTDTTPEVVPNAIEALNPELVGLGRYEYGWADSDAAGSVAQRGLNEAVDLGVRGLGDGRHCDVLRMVGLGRSVVPGTYVVQTPSPWAMVASRWTCVPSRRANASVSASHSSGNFSATCATGQ